MLVDYFSLIYVASLLLCEEKVAGGQFGTGVTRVKIFLSGLFYQLFVSASPFGLKFDEVLCFACVFCFGGKGETSVVLVFVIYFCFDSNVV